MRLISETKNGPKTTRVYEDVTPDDVARQFEEAKQYANGDEATLRAIDRDIATLKRMGRKPKPERKRRVNLIQARFNADELEMIEAVRAVDDAEISVIVRELALEAARARLGR